MNLIVYRKNEADINALVQRLDKLKQGEFVSYTELTVILGRNIIEKRYFLDTARNRLLKQGKVFECVTSKGVKRLSDREIIHNAPHDLKSIREKAKKSVKKLTAVGWDGLSQEEQHAHNLYISQLGALAYASDTGRMKQLAAACQNGNPTGLPTAITLRLLAS